jgi:hypothetical protein
MKLLNWKKGNPKSATGLVSKIKVATVTIAAPAPVRTKPTEFENFLSMRTEFLLVMRNAGYISEAEFNANHIYSSERLEKTGSM